MIRAHKTGFWDQHIEILIAVVDLKPKKGHFWSKKLLNRVPKTGFKRDIIIIIFWPIFGFLQFKSVIVIFFTLLGLHCLLLCAF